MVLEEVKVKYVLLDGEVIEKTKTIKEFPGHYSFLDFISQAEEEPNGMFFISGIDVLKKEFTLTKIDCDELHWKRDENRKGYGPDENCELKKCPFRKECPISTHIIMMADID